jgi:type IV pilus assembly protein PilB
MTVATVDGAEVARARALASRSGLPWIDLDAERIERAAIDAVPLALAEATLAVPLRLDGDRLTVALADPGTLSEFEAGVGIPTEFFVAPRGAVVNVLGSLRQVRRRGMPVSAMELPNLAAPDVEMQALRRAALAGATDVHFVPGQAGLAIRVRIDGGLRALGVVPPPGSAALIQRLKVQASLDIGESRHSQEGRLALELEDGRVYDIRLTTVTTVAGEGAALRLLERSRRAPTLTETGLLPELQLALERLVGRRRGALLVTGPTGSGKSTTIHAALAAIASSQLNLVTIEDPVEYRLDGAYQIEVNPHAQVTFESGLRAILRSDPDVIAVGEMRDLATAASTLKAALSGAFLLSTLHTADAPSAIVRLREMGVEPYVTAATVRGVLAQRLVRRLCVHCRQRHQLSVEEAAAFGIESGNGPAYLFDAVGCDACDRGYRGQIAVHQLMLVDDEVRRLTLAGGGGDEIAWAASAAGMRTLREDGLAKALAGLTTLDELHTVLPSGE